jgi:hypothetical protein
MRSVVRRIRHRLRPGGDDGGAMSEYTIKLLGPDTWDAFAQLVSVSFLDNGTRASSNRPASTTTGAKG